MYRAAGDALKLKCRTYEDGLNDDKRRLIIPKINFSVISFKSIDWGVKLLRRRAQEKFSLDTFLPMFVLYYRIQLFVFNKSKHCRKFGTKIVNFSKTFFNF